MKLTIKLVQTFPSLFECNSTMRIVYSIQSDLLSEKEFYTVK